MVPAASGSCGKPRSYNVDRLSERLAAFLYRVNYGNVTFRYYYPSQISACEQRIGFTRKRGSTTAFQAFLPRNIQKRWCYWNLPYPYGIEDVRCQDMIDLARTSF